MTTEKSLAVAALLTQFRKLLESISISNVARTRGRPPTIATLFLRAHAAYLTSTRPGYARQPSSGPSSLMTALPNKGAFASVRKSYGLHHKTIPERLVLDVFALDEGPDPECEARHPAAPTYAELHERTMAKLESKKSEIAINAKKSGQKVSLKTQESQIKAAAADLLQELAAKRITPETMQARLRNLPVSLPIPSIRHLRRMAQEIRGQEPAPK